MSKKLGNIKIELLYLLFIAVITVYFSYSTHILGDNTYLLSAGLGTLLILTWFIRAFALYSGRKISKYSDVIQRISVKERFFSYFVLPVIFYLSLLLYLYFNTSFVMDLVVSSVVLVQILILFVNVKSSFKKVYTISSNTRAIFDFICISVFYLCLSVMIRLLGDVYLVLVSTFLLSVILLIADLKIHNKGGMLSLLMSIVSSIFISVFVCSFYNSNVFVIPAVGTLAYYLVISLWNIRFSGKTKFSDYLLPFIYSILALILILNL